MKRSYVFHSSKLNFLTQLVLSATLLILCSAIFDIPAQAGDNIPSRSERRQERRNRFLQNRKKLPNPQAHKRAIKSTEQEYTDEEQVDFSEALEFANQHPVPKDFGISHKNKYEPQEIEIHQESAGPKSFWGNVGWGLLQWTGGIVHNSTKFQAIGSKAHQDALNALRGQQSEPVAQPEPAQCESSTAALTIPTDMHPIQTIENAIGIGVGVSFGHSEADFTPPPPVEPPTPATPSEWSTFKEEFRLDKDRLITVDAVAGDSPSLTISDNFGPSAGSHAGRWHEEYLTQQPEFGSGWRRKKEHVDKPIPGHSRVFGKPLSITLNSKSLDGWEDLDFLRGEVASLSYQALEDFVRTHHQDLEKPFEKGKEMLTKKPDDQILQEQISNLEPLLHPYIVQDCSNLSSIGKGNCEVMNYMHDPARIRNKHLENAQFLRNGKYIPPMPILYHTDKLLESPLIVTHANWATSKEQTRAIDHLVAAAKAAGHPVVYLVDGLGMTDSRVVTLTKEDEVLEPHFFDSSHQGGLGLKDREPTVALYSQSGENWVLNPSSDIIIVGSLWGKCHRLSTEMAILNHFYLHPGSVPLTVHMPMAAINGCGGTLEDCLHDFDRNPSFFENYVEEALFYDSGSNLPLELPNEYQIHVSIDGREIIKKGTGTKLVYIKLWSTAKFLKDILANIRSPFKSN